MRWVCNLGEQSAVVATIIVDRDFRGKGTLSGSK